MLPSGFLLPEVEVVGFASLALEVPGLTSSNSAPVGHLFQPRGKIKLRLALGLGDPGTRRRHFARVSTLFGSMQILHPVQMGTTGDLVMGAPHLLLNIEDSHSREEHATLTLCLDGPSNFTLPVIPTTSEDDDSAGSFAPPGSARDGTALSLHGAVLACLDHKHRQLDIDLRQAEGSGVKVCLVILLSETLVSFCVLVLYPLSLSCVVVAFPLILVCGRFSLLMMVRALPLFFNCAATASSRIHHAQGSRCVLHKRALQPAW